MSTGSELYDLLAKTNATLNPNNTITLRFNDGSSYTTGVIKDGPELSPADKAMEEAKEASTISQAAMEEAGKAAIAAGNAEQSASEAAASATNAENFASEAQQSASAAASSATNAETSAGNAATSAGNAATSAQAAATSASAAEGSAQTAASEAAEAKTQAAEAKTSATNASEYASRALGNLSTVQSVTETLNWITAHGTMTLTSDTALDSSHVYFVRNNDGDYVVGGNHYSVVTEPNVDNISTYYELTIDESLNNYVGTHLSVTSEGLWLLPDAGGNKVLIATGSGSTYSTAGTYIVSGSAILASFTAGGAQIGQNVSGMSRAVISEDGMQIYRNASGTDTQIVNLGYGLGNAQDSTENAPYYTLGIRGLTMERYDPTLTYTVGDMCVYNDGSGDKIYICYSDTTGAWDASKWWYYIGNYSMAEGWNTKSCGYGSHAEGNGTAALGAAAHAEGRSSIATGFAHAEGHMTKAFLTGSHSEGDRTRALGYASHAQNWFTVANEQAQTVIGRYNDNQTDTAFEIGNGEHNARSNALTVDWQGNVKTAGSVTENNGTRDIDLNISEATIQKFIDLGMSLT